GITSIGDFAFNINNLASVTIPSGVTSIGIFAFTFNPLTSVTIPASVTSIGEGSFESDHLKSVMILNRSMTIGSDAFAGNQSSPANLTITGHDGSAVANWADHKGFTFQKLSKIFPFKKITDGKAEIT